MTTHAQVEVPIDGRQVQVDEEIAGLITALWRVGVRTSYSCQHDPGPLGLPDRYPPAGGYIQLVLPDADELRRLLLLLPDTDVLHSALKFPRGLEWKYSVRPTIYPCHLESYDPPALRLQVCVYVPREQHAVLLEALQAADAA